MEYVTANKEYKRICNEKKRAHEEEMAIILSQSRDSAEFWSLTRKLNGDNNKKEDAVIAVDDLRVHFPTLLYLTEKTV